MSQRTRSERERRVRRGYGVARPAAWLGAVLALWSAHCGFPEYDLSRVDPTGGSAGSAGSGAANGAAAGQASGASASLGGAGETGEGGAAGLAEGGGPECRGEQWPTDLCEGGCLRRYPDHCYDGVSGAGELDVDCGGDCQACTLESCTEGSDCLSGVCASLPDGMACRAPLILNYTAHEMNATVGSTAWSMVLRNAEELDGETFTFKDLEIRFYFDRNGVVEPIVVRATQSNLLLSSGESRELKATSWVLERVEEADETEYNAYLSVKFGDAGQLFPGDKISLYEQMLTGAPAISMFDQRANYSFTTEQAVDWLRINVFYQGKLLWGREPRPKNPRACFARGVNLNGPNVANVLGHDWQGAAEAGVTSSGSGIAQGTTSFPVVTGGLASVLGTATRLQAGQTLELPTDNGQYLAYLYAVSSTNDAQPSTLTVQGIDHLNSSAFRAQAVDSGYAWARLGPYRVDITTGSLGVAVTTGAIHFAGVELWYPQ